MLQLPLYAMAVERIIFRGDELSALHDVGYWGLRDDGFKPIAFERLGGRPGDARCTRTGELVDQLRRGVFVVQSQDDGMRGLLRVPGVCRVRQVRRRRRSRPESARAQRGSAPRKAAEGQIRWAWRTEPDREPGATQSRTSHEPRTP